MSVSQGVDASGLPAVWYEVVSQRDCHKIIGDLIVECLCVFALMDASRAFGAFGLRCSHEYPTSPLCAEQILPCTCNSRSRETRQRRRIPTEVLSVFCCTCIIKLIKLILI